MITTNSKFTIKLQCLALAVEADTETPMDLANEMYDWLMLEVTEEEPRDAQVIRLTPVN